MSLSPKDEKQTTYGNYNVYGNDMILDTAPAQKFTPAPKPVAARESRKTSNKTSERDELLKLYYERDKEFEAAKGKRMLLTFLFFIAAYYVLFCLIFSWPDDLIIAIVCLLPSSFFAVGHYFVNSAIFGYLHTKGREENEILERIRKRIQDLDKQ